MNLKEAVKTLFTSEQVDKIKALKKEFAEFAPVPQAPATPSPAPAAPANPAPVAPIDTTLEDGTPVKIEGGIQAGSSISVVTPNGIVPAPDGELELSTGEILTVSGGKITAVTPASEPAPQMPAMPNMPDMSAQFKEIESKFSAVEAENKSLKEIIESNKKELADLKKSFSVVIDTISALTDLPTDKPIETPSVSAFSSKVDSKVNKLFNLKTK